MDEGVLVKCGAEVLVSTRERGPRTAGPIEASRP